jgi:hypothetical protein
MSKITKEELPIEEISYKLSEITDKEEKAIKDLELEYKCLITCTTEKHNSLQYTYFWEIDFGLDENLFIEIESGINNGTQINDCNWYRSSPYDITKNIEVLDTIKFSEELFDAWYAGSKENKNFVLEKAKIIFNNNKEEILSLYKNKNYDEYVTGGGTYIINNYYKDKFAKLKNKGVFWECVYKEITVQRNFR